MSFFPLQTEARYLKPRNPTPASKKILVRVPKVKNRGKKEFALKIQELAILSILAENQ